MAQIDEFVWEALTFLTSANPKDIRSLGKITNESSRVKQNPHGEGSITYRTFRLDGLEIQQRSFGSPTQHQLVLVTVSSPRWSIKDELVVGAPTKRVLGILGEPTESNTHRLTYRGESEQVVFEVKRGRITRIQFVYYAD
jgi:hypothetical protein